MEGADVSAPKAKLPAAPESKVQRALIEVLEVFGYVVYRVGQRNATGTQDPGVSDLIALCARDRLILFVEAKKVGGRQSLAQRGFQLAIEAAGGYYILADDAVVLAGVLALLRAQSTRARERREEEAEMLRVHLSQERPRR